MANTAFIVTSIASGNIGQAGPVNAQIYADLVVKNDHDIVVFSQQAGCNAPLNAADTRQSILSKLAASARGVMNDPSMKVVFL